jgi:AAA domain
MPTHPADQFAGQRLKALSDLPLIGRDPEMATLLISAATKRPILIYGPSGLGKTRLLLELARKLSANRVDVAYIRFQPSLHTLLLELTVQLRLNCANTSSIGLRGALWKAFAAKPYVILLDDIAEATPPFYRFLQRIIREGCNTIIGAAAHAHAAGSLHHIFWNQQANVALHSLGRRDAGRLIKGAISAFLADVPMAPDFAVRVAQVARGNPGRIVEMCIRAADPAYRAQDDHIRFGALVMDSFTGLLP